MRKKELKVHLCIYILFLRRQGFSFLYTVQIVLGYRSNDLLAFFFHFH